MQLFWWGQPIFVLLATFINMLCNDFCNILCDIFCTFFSKPNMPSCVPIDLQCLWTCWFEFPASLNSLLLQTDLGSSEGVMGFLCGAYCSYRIVLLHALCMDYWWNFLHTIPMLLIQQPAAKWSITVCRYPGVYYDIYWTLPVLALFLLYYLLLYLYCARVLPLFWNFLGVSHYHVHTNAFTQTLLYHRYSIPSYIPAPAIAGVHSAMCLSMNMSAVLLEQYDFMYHLNSLCLYWRLSLRGLYLILVLHASIRYHGWSIPWKVAAAAVCTVMKVYVHAVPG